MRYTCDQLMTADWTINSDINLQELSDWTSIVDSSGKLQCHYNNMITTTCDGNRYNPITIIQGSIPKPAFTLTR